MNAAVSVQPTQFVVDVSDTTLVNDIRRAIKMIRGVSAVHISRTRTRAKEKSGLEEALDDVREGRVTHWNGSVDDMIDSILKG